ncbi:MAG: DUF454 domain-containing protein [Candidatus Bathyarchaeum sp.]|nr:MAG: DUF454 domain-containing protein [Candidatus Bathyarchaeum sp.]
MQHNPKINTEASARQKFVRAFLIVAGTVFLGLGTIGIVLPVLPTTPFLLLALACYFRSSERMTHWMLTNKYFGKYIKNYREGKGIPLKTKVVAITILWAAILYSSFFIIPFWIAQLIMIAVAVAVTVHLVKLPTYRQKVSETVKKSGY